MGRRGVRHRHLDPIPRRLPRPPHRSREGQVGEARAQDVPRHARARRWAGHGRVPREAGLDLGGEAAARCDGVQEGTALKLAFRPAAGHDSDDRAFVVATWSSSYKSSRYAGILWTDDYADVMH